MQNFFASFFAPDTDSLAEVKGKWFPALGTIDTGIELMCEGCE